MANSTKKNTNVNANVVVAKEEKTMANTYEINTKENVMNEVEFTIEYQKKNGAIIPVIDGEPREDLLMGYVSESDMKAGMELLEAAIKAADGNIERAKYLMYTGAINTAKDIRPEEQLEVEGIQMMIDYNTNIIYTIGRTQVADLEDMSDEVKAVLPREAVKALLVEKAKVWVASQQEREDTCEAHDGECDDCPYYDECCC